MESSLMEYSEVKNVSDTSFEDGFGKGELAKALKIAKALKDKQLSVEFIMETTGLSQYEIEAL